MNEWVQLRVKEASYINDPGDWLQVPERIFADVRHRCFHAVGLISSVVQDAKFRRRVSLGTMGLKFGKKK